MARKKKNDKSKKKGISVLPTSYAVQTAETALRGYEVNFSNDEIADQLRDDNSFYKLLLGITASGIYNNYILDQSNDAHYYAQENLMNISFANHQYIVAKDDLTAGLSQKKLQQLDKLQDTCDLTKSEIIKLKREQAKIDKQAKKLLAEKIKAWHKLQDEQIDKITQLLEEKGFNVSIEFKMRLRDKLDKQSAGVKIPSQVTESLKLKQVLTTIEKAVLSTLAEEERHVSH